MRPAFASILLAASLLLTPSAFAVRPDLGKLVQGKYFANGSASVAGVKVQYARSKARITNRGKIKGRVTKVITSGGRTLSVTSIKLRGTVSGIKPRGRTFTAKAQIRLGDGVRVRGEFQGLTDRSQRLSRFFRGKMNGDSRSNFVLRAR